MKNVLAGLERFGGEGAKIRATLDDGTLTSIECAGPLAWLPIDVHLELCHRVVETLGPERFQLFIRDLMRRAYEESSLHRLFHTALGILGFDPGSLARFVPRGYDLLFRRCGHWRVERIGEAFDGTEAVSTLMLEQLPKCCVEDRVWVDSVACSLNALLVLAEAEGSVDVDAINEDAGYVRYRLSWAPPA